MEYQKPKIQFYKVRTFGEILNISFEFLRETWKPLLKYSFYLILPVCLLQSFAMDAYMRLAFSGSLADGNEDFTSLVLNYGIVMLCIICGSSILSAMVYGLMQTYDRRENRLSDLTFADFKEALVKNLIKIGRTFLFFFGVTLLLVILIGFLTAASTWTLLVTIPVLLIGLVVVVVPLMLFIPLYLFEDLPFFEALNKAWGYGFSTWGELFLVMLVFGLLAGIINTVTAIPWYVVQIAGQVFSLVEPDSGVNSALWYRFATYLLGILQAYGTYIGSIVSTVGVAFQYFRVREKKEGVSVRANIANFDRL